MERQLQPPIAGSLPRGFGSGAGAPAGARPGGAPGWLDAGRRPESSPPVPGAGPAGATNSRRTSTRGTGAGGGRQGAPSGTFRNPVPRALEHRRGLSLGRRRAVGRSRHWGCSPRRRPVWRGFARIRTLGDDAHLPLARDRGRRVIGICGSWRPRSPVSGLGAGRAACAPLAGGLRHYANAPERVEPDRGSVAMTRSRRSGVASVGREAVGAKNCHFGGGGVRVACGRGAHCRYSLFGAGSIVASRVARNAFLLRISTGRPRGSDSTWSTWGYLCA